MRSRNIKPGFFKNEELAECSFVARLLFIGLWCLADREGRLEKRPKRIKAEIFPYDDGVDINGELTVIERLGFVQTYVVDGVEYLLVVNFKEHQKPHHTEAKSKLPSISDGCLLTVNSPLDNGKNPPDSLIPDSLIPDSLIPDVVAVVELATHQDTPATAAEKTLTACFDQNETRLRDLYPHADYEIERETCIAHYRSSHPPLDPYVVILKWFNRIPKPKANGREPPKTFEQLKMERTKQAAREFAGGG